jgi:hypothetical protein
VPFTPFHLGAGAVFKAAGGRHFSFMVFGGTQVLMDLEPGYMLITGGTPLHGPSHTLGGALVLGIFGALIGKPISELAFRLVGRVDLRIGWTAAITGALFGSFSHVLLDAIMHADMRPWWPFTGTNGLLGWLPISHLHVYCVVLGVMGGIGVWLRGRADADRRYPEENAG